MPPPPMDCGSPLPLSPSQPAGRGRCFGVSVRQQKRKLQPPRPDPCPLSHRPTAAAQPPPKHRNTGIPILSQEKSLVTGGALSPRAHANEERKSEAKQSHSGIPWSYLSPSIRLLPRRCSATFAPPPRPFATFAPPRFKFSPPAPHAAGDNWSGPTHSPKHRNTSLLKNLQSPIFTPAISSPTLLP